MQPLNESILNECRFAILRRTGIVCRNDLRHIVSKVHNNGPCADKNVATSQPLNQGRHHCLDGNEGSRADVERSFNDMVTLISRLQVVRIHILSTKAKKVTPGDLFFSTSLSVLQLLLHFFGKELGNFFNIIADFWQIDTAMFFYHCF